MPLDGLNIGNMNAFYGEGGTHMHKSIVGKVGSYDGLLSDTQDMSINSSNSNPFGWNLLKN